MLRILGIGLILTTVLWSVNRAERFSDAVRPFWGNVVDCTNGVPIDNVSIDNMLPPVLKIKAGSGGLPALLGEVGI